MVSFIEFVVKKFIDEADKLGHKPQMLKAFREETDEQLVERVGSVMDGLEMAFVMETGQPLMIHSRQENTRAVVNELKKSLASQIATATT
jgi:hypothetical protein